MPDAIDASVFKKEGQTCRVSNKTFIFYFQLNMLPRTDIHASTTNDDDAPSYERTRARMGIHK